MEFRQVEAFIVVSEQESFTRAAESLHLTQSAVSQLIRRLEEEIGEPLFVRNGRSVRPTRTGIELLPAAMEIVRWKRVFADRSVADPARISGVLRVGTSSAGTAFLWAWTFQAFAQTYPLVELDVRSTQQTINTMEDLLGGDLDVGIMPFPVPHPRLTGVVLGHHEALLVASPEHPLAARKRLRVADLETARFISYEHRMNIRGLSDQYFSSLGISPNMVLQSNDTYLIRAMTEVGFGIAFLPDWAVQRELEEGRLVVLDKPGLRLFENFGAMHLARGIGPAAQEFIRFCLQHVELLPPVARGPLQR
ncbi:LysR family transcriptional regulator [Propionivibrio sp.]|uniref:LysR family transcriptional regulator n=1 Tax=Propionivibrio sp. TaxID=2212460 RepID=UPI0039E45C3C